MTYSCTVDTTCSIVPFITIVESFFRKTFLHIIYHFHNLSLEEVHDVSGQVPKISGEVQIDLRRGVQLPPNPAIWGGGGGGFCGK